MSNVLWVDMYLIPCSNICSWCSLNCLKMNSWSPLGFIWESQRKAGSNQNHSHRFQANVLNTELNSGYDKEAKDWFFGSNKKKGTVEFVFYSPYFIQWHVLFTILYLFIHQYIFILRETYFIQQQLLANLSLLQGEDCQKSFMQLKLLSSSYPVTGHTLSPVKYEDIEHNCSNSTKLWNWRTDKKSRYTAPVVFLIRSTNL